MMWRLSQNCYPLLVNILKWSSKYSHCSKIYIRSRRFWVKGQLAFFDIRVFDSNAKRYLHSALPQCYTQNVKEKKRQYNKRVLQIEHGGFSPLISYGGMSHECSTFIVKSIIWKRDILPSAAINWIQTKISFALLQSCLLRLRGRRSLSWNIVTVRDDVQFSCEVLKIPRTEQCLCIFKVVCTLKFE